MAATLHSRPNLDHLRRQAKALLARLQDGDKTAARAFIDHLPDAKGMTPKAVAAAGFRLADAQSVVARRSGFGSWPALARHVEHLRALEGDWRFVALEVDGAPVPAAMLSQSKLLIDGDRFRMESPEATYEGEFTIDVTASPSTIDIEFVEGPEAGQWSYGIYTLDGDDLTFCLGLTGAARPSAFRTDAGSGHALERLRRTSATRPAGVKGGTRAKATKTAAADIAPVDIGAFDGPMTPALERLEGEWTAVRLITSGEPLKEEWLPFGSRTSKDGIVKVVFGGQVMVHARVRLDDRGTPIAVDYLHLSGGHKGRVSLGILEWAGDIVRFLMAAPGEPRPDDFTCAKGSGRTLSEWKKKS